MDGQTKRGDLSSWILTAGQFGLAGAIAFFGPTRPIPMHFGLDGEVDRWGGRLEMAAVVLLLAVISAVAMLFARRPDQEVHLLRDRRYSQRAVVWVLSLVALLSACLTWGWFDQPGPRFGMAVISVLLAVVGVLLGKTSPNAMIGVRTPWTYASRLSWEKANRLAGRLFFWGGALGALAAPFAPQPEGLRAVTLGTLLVGAVSVFESWRVWRADPDRAA
jgi:uncharacterized membrane protein